jgi:hypothetical protein
MKDKWDLYHESKINLKDALERHLENIDKVFVYDKTNDDGDYGAEMESQGTSLMREILAKITRWKKQYDENVKNNNKKI